MRLPRGVGHVPSQKNMIMHSQTPSLSRFIVAILNLATSHIPHHTAKALGEKDSQDKPALWDTLSYLHFHEYGWLIHCNLGHVEEIQSEHPELANLMRMALSTGAEYLKLDCDAMSCEKLPQFEWPAAVIN